MTAASTTPPPALPPQPSSAAADERPLSPLRLRLRRFRRLKRGYYSFVLLVGLYVLTFFNGCLVNNQALVVRYQGQFYFPQWTHYEGKAFGQTVVRGQPHFGEADYRELKQQFAAEQQGNWVLLPPYPYHPHESLLFLEGRPPHSPSWQHWLGTDDRGRDILSRLIYGFRISLNFALVVTALTYLLGILSGAILGYFGSWIDLLGVRLVEIWSTIPFLYTVIIISASLRPNFYWLAALLAVFEWVGIAMYVRGEFLREKAKEYVAAALAVGEGHGTIIFHHILPNALTPVISFAPFAIVGNITALASLDFLGFGLAPPTASWGELIQQGRQNIFEWHLVAFPLVALFLTLTLIVFIGEAVREAFDPKVFSRLR